MLGNEVKTLVFLIVTLKLPQTPYYCCLLQLFDRKNSTIKAKFKKKMKSSLFQLQLSFYECALQPYLRKTVSYIDSKLQQFIKWYCAANGYYAQQKIKLISFFPSRKRILYQFNKSIFFLNPKYGEISNMPKCVASLRSSCPHKIGNI